MVHKIKGLFPLHPDSFLVHRRSRKGERHVMIDHIHHKLTTPLPEFFACEGLGIYTATRCNATKLYKLNVYSAQYIPSTLCPIDNVEIVFHLP